MEFSGVTRIIVIMLVVRVVMSLLNKKGKKNSSTTKPNMNRATRINTVNKTSKMNMDKSRRKEVRTPTSNLNMGLKKSLLNKDTKPNGQMSPLDRMAIREKELERKNR